MVLTLQQQKFTAMLEEAIVLICRSSLPYRCEAKVEGLIAITIDYKDFDVIKIYEKFDNKTPILPSYMPSDDLSTESSLDNPEKEDQSFELQNGNLNELQSEEIPEPKSKKRKRETDKHSCNENGLKILMENANVRQNNVNALRNEQEIFNCIHSVNQLITPADSNLVCNDVVEIKSEKSCENFFDCLPVPEEPLRYKRDGKGCYIYEDYNSRASVKVEKFQMPKDTSDTKSPNMTPAQVSMATEILSISGSFVNIGSAKAFQHNLRVLSKSELSEVVNGMSLPPGNPHSVGVLCTEGVSRVFYKIPPSLIKQEALDFFSLDFFSYNSLYHSAVRIPHNIRDPEEWKALVAMKNPFGDISTSSARSVLGGVRLDNQN